mmetsp:Transcript_15889/g.49949  ORF Transcript_15889/g.49949 Transcript_15889/m.49949 type:complete len:100 (-) Transcript_15889:14-313(-)
MGARRVGGGMLSHTGKVHGNARQHVDAQRTQLLTPPQVSGVGCAPREDHDGMGLLNRSGKPGGEGGAAGGSGGGGGGGGGGLLLVHLLLIGGGGPWLVF